MQLSELQISKTKVLIKNNAAEDANKQFGWSLSDVKDAYRKLQPKHFHKTDASKCIPRVAIDAYKAIINGEKIYTHFYIDDKSGFLVINSFHEQ